MPGSRAGAGFGIVANMFDDDARNALIGSAIIAAGVPVQRWRGRRGPPEAPRDLPQATLFNR